MFELYLKHGRHAPDEHLDDWGFDGPRLQNVIGLHQTYFDHIRVVFSDPTTKRIAQDITQWEECDNNTLELRRYEDMIEITNIDGTKHYFGDWGLWSPEHKDGKHY